MKRIFLLSTCIAASIFSQAQSAKTYAITGEGKGSYNWIQVKQINMATGVVEQNIFNPKEQKPINYTAPGNQRTTVSIADESTATMVAAAAFDAKHNRLYFTTMRGNSLRFFDLNETQTSINVNNDAAFNTGSKFIGEANIITRMAFAANGIGYAISNDGNNLISFTTDEKPVITNLGSLIDGKKNGQVSVHTQCTSWGGDIIGDAYGNLYLITVRNLVFKINPQTRITDYVGTVKGLPADFTTNGAAVEGDGNIIVSSSILTDTYYRINMGTLQATAISKTEETVHNASDLANGNLLYSESRVAATPKAELKGNSAVTIYPNPAINKSFQISFDNAEAGAYTIELSDASGRKVVNQKATISKFQTERVKLPNASTPGVYMLKVLNAKGQAVYNDKIIVQ